MVRLPEAPLFLLTPTYAVPCARTVRTAMSCSRSPRRALRLLAAAERRLGAPRAFGTRASDSLRSPDRLPLWQPASVPRGDQFLGALGHIFISFGALFTGVPSTSAERCAHAAIRCASDDRGRTAHGRPDCGGAAATRISSCTWGSACPLSFPHRRVMPASRCRTLHLPSLLRGPGALVLVGHKAWRQRRSRDHRGTAAPKRGAARDHRVAAGGAGGGTRRACGRACQAPAGCCCCPVRSCAGCRPNGQAVTAPAESGPWWLGTGWTAARPEAPGLPLTCLLLGGHWRRGPPSQAPSWVPLHWAFRDCSP